MQNNLYVVSLQECKLSRQKSKNRQPCSTETVRINPDSGRPSLKALSQDSVSGSEARDGISDNTVRPRRRPVPEPRRHRVDTPPEVPSRVGRRIDRSLTLPTPRRREHHAGMPTGNDCNFEASPQISRRRGGSDGSSHTEATNSPTVSPRIPPRKVSKGGESMPRNKPDRPVVLIGHPIGAGSLLATEDCGPKTISAASYASRLSEDDLCMSLRRLGLESSLKIFQLNHIDGTNLVGFSEEAFVRTFGMSEADAKMLFTFLTTEAEGPTRTSWYNSYWFPL